MSTYFDDLTDIHEAMASNTKLLDCPKLEYFRECAIKGKSPGASSGEKACARIAKAISEMADDLSRIDHNAARGAIALMRLAAGPWEIGGAHLRVREMLEATGGK